MRKGNGGGGDRVGSAGAGAQQPDWRAEVEQRLRSTKLDGATERDVADELAQHLEDRYAELTAAGVPAADARAQVLEELDEPGVFSARIKSTLRGRPEPIAIGAAPAGTSRYGRTEPSAPHVLADWFSDLKV